MKNQHGHTLVELLFVLVSIVGLGGWVNNILILVDSTLTSLTIMIVLRIVGIFVFPLGAVLGFV